MQCIVLLSVWRPSYICGRIGIRMLLLSASYLMTSFIFLWRHQIVYLGLSFCPWCILSSSTALLIPGFNLCFSLPTSPPFCCFCISRKSAENCWLCPISLILDLWAFRSISLSAVLNISLEPFPALLPISRRRGGEMPYLMHCKSVYDRRGGEGGSQMKKLQTVQATDLNAVATFLSGGLCWMLFA